MAQEPSEQDSVAPAAEEKTPKIRSIKVAKAAKGRAPKKPSRPPRPGPEQRPTRYLPTDRLAFSRQLDALRAFAAASGPSAKPVSNQDVAAIMKIHHTTVSLCNAFFVENGFLQRIDAGTFVPAPEVLNFARTYDWNPDAAGQKLAPIMAATWFGECLMPRLSFGPLETDDALAELANAAAASPEYRGQMRMLLDYLAVAGLIQREGSIIRQGKATPASDAPTERQAPPATPAPEVRENAPGRLGIATAFLQQPTEGVVQFHVTVRVDMGEFADWPADRIAAFFAGIAQVLAAKGAIEKAASG